MENLNGPLTREWTVIRKKSHRVEPRTIWLLWLLPFLLACFWLEVGFNSSHWSPSPPVAHRPLNVWLSFCQGRGVVVVLNVSFLQLQCLFNQCWIFALTTMVNSVCSSSHKIVRLFLPRPHMGEGSRQDFVPFSHWLLFPSCQPTSWGMLSQDCHLNSIIFVCVQAPGEVHDKELGS